MSRPNELKRPAEWRFADELAALAAHDDDPKPDGWRLSPRAVKTFILGNDGESLRHEVEGATVETTISAKYVGSDLLVERAIVSLLGNRGLLLVGEPGTAKSMLSELLAAAISGDSTLTIQGTAGTTEDQIKYSWNYALLLAEGPGLRSLVPGPLYRGLDLGQIVRFEEITRCQPEIQDALVSVLSEKSIVLPELSGDARVLLAKRGFNVIATANLRDRGVHDMSSALKRRFNFETVNPIADAEFEKVLVARQVAERMAEHPGATLPDTDVIDLLVTVFRDLRTGKLADGTSVNAPKAVMSTAESVNVAHAATLDATYLDAGPVSGRHLARQIQGVVFKDDPEDARKLATYVDLVARDRARGSKLWADFHKEAQAALSNRDGK